MSAKISVELGDVQQTLLLPLWGRAVETQKPVPLLRDDTAVEIIKNIHYDFALIARNISFISQLAWIARSLHIDNTLRLYLKQYPNATIVNIGCGLDTTFDRIDNGTLQWYDLDLPDVIALRRHFIQEHERRTFIAGSFLDEDWLQHVTHKEHVFFIAAGVLYYFEASQIRTVFARLTERCPGSELIFDASSPLGVKVANKQVIRNSGMDERSFLKWGLKHADELQAWDSRITIVETYTMFRQMRKSLTFKEKIGTLLSDVMNIMYMVHLRFEQSRSHT